MVLLWLGTVVWYVKYMLLRKMTHYMEFQKQKIYDLVMNATQVYARLLARLKTCAEGFL